MRFLVAASALLCSFMALAQNSVTLEERETWTIVRGSTTVQPSPFIGSAAECRARIAQLARAETRTSGTLTYRCQTRRLETVATYGPATPPPPPTPINCAVGPWTQGPLVPATCPVSGQQSRTDTRSIVTQPANGGAACPSLTQTVSVACTPPVDPPPPPTGSAPYDLGPVPFAYVWPTPPVTTRTVNVSTIAQFQAAVQQSGARVVVAPGTYRGALNVTGSDLDIQVSNQAIITAGVLQWGNYTTVIRPARVRWTGGNLIDGGMVLTPIDDLQVIDFFVDNVASASPEGIHNLTGSVGSFWTGQGVRQGWNRQAWINSTIRLRGGESGGGWAFFSNPNGSASAAAGGGTLILANVKVQTTGGQNNRFMAIQNLIIVDSVFNPDGLSANGMRIHQASTNVFMRDSWVRGLWKLDPTNGSDSGPQVLNATFLRVAHYDQNWAGLAVTGNSPNTGTVRDSNFYSGTGTGSPYIAPFTGSGNRLLPWDGVTVPDYSAVGARR